jgi:hypothetical protein
MTPAAVALADKIYDPIRRRMQAERGDHGFDRKRLAELRANIERTIEYCGDQAERAFEEAQAIYQPLPSDWGRNLMGLMYSISSYAPDEPEAEPTPAEAGPAEPADEPAPEPDESPDDEPGGRILFRSTTRRR